MGRLTPSMSFVISGRVATRFLEAPVGEVHVSLDLGLTRSAVTVQEDHVLLPDGARLSKRDLAECFKDPQDCIEIAGAGCRKIYHYCPQTRRYYKLFQPFEDRAPTVVIAGATMHAIVRMDPWADEAEKTRLLSSKGGECLDTCFGLGYSAQLLARAGFDRVVSCEVDTNVLACAAVNPWSRAALQDQRIEIVQTDVRDYLRGCQRERFAAIFHDPPTVHLAGELYSTALYAELARVLLPGGTLYHYVGSPGGRLGADHAGRIIQRLREMGFVNARRRARGVLARRGS